MQYDLVPEVRYEVHMLNLGRWRQRNQEFKVSLSYARLEKVRETQETDLVIAWGWATLGSERPGARGWRGPLNRNKHLHAAEPSLLKIKLWGRSAHTHA